MNNNKPIPLFRNWTAESSIIKNTSYNIEKKIMTVEFNTTGKYEYYEVPFNIWKLSLMATSIGKFINSNLKGEYLCKQIT